MTRRLLAAAVLVLASQPILDACTTFCVRAGDRVLFGRNYDFEIGDGQVMVNAAGLERKGFLEGGPAWRARHGSVTFNQFGRGFPMGGINESGVVVELMWLNPDARRTDRGRVAARILGCLRRLIRRRCRLGRQWPPPSLPSASTPSSRSSRIR